MKITRTQHKHRSGFGWRLWVAITALLILAPSAGAQVTIGDGIAPQDFSTLEIVSNSIGGLRLPHLTTLERNTLTNTTTFQNEIVKKGRGLTIYNIDTNCVEFWNSQKWVSLCDGTILPCEPITAVSVSGGMTITQWATTPIILTATVTGGTATSYEWYRNGTLVATTTTHTYTVPQTVNDEAGTHAYTVKAINVCSNWTSSATNVIVSPCTKITGVSITGGTTITQWATTAITLTATVTGGAATSYEWYRNGSKEATTATNTYPVPQGVKDTYGTHTYTVKAINDCSKVVSTATDVVVSPCTKITGTTITGGTTITQWVTTAITLTATVTGGTATSYEWFKGGTSLGTTTVNTYTVPQTVKDEAGTHVYTVVAKNDCSQVLTSVATNVVVTACTKITGATITGGTTITQWATTAITLTATATGGAATSYEWFKGGVSIGTTTVNTYTVPQTVKDEAGTHAYTVKAINACSEVLTSVATNVVVTACTKITGVTISGGVSIPQYTASNIVLTATVTGGAATSYEWFKGGTSLGTTTVATYTISAATVSTLTTGTHAYTVKAINACTSITSTATNVVVSVRPAISPNYNVDTGNTTLNLDGVFNGGSGDATTRGTGVAHSVMNAGVFRYTGGAGQTFYSVSNAANGITATVFSASGKLASGAGELTITVSGTPVAGVAGKAFDIPITVLGYQLYVRVHVGCGAYTSTTRTIPSTGGDPAWLQLQCFNLGATAGANPVLSDASTYGDLYQWGRKGDGTYEKRSNTNFTTIRATNTAATLPATVVGKFILYNGGDWLENGNSYTTRWSDTKATNDPCPAGWKVTTQTQWTAIIASNTAVWKGNGHTVGKGLFLPAAGLRYYQTGVIQYVGTSGGYWSSNHTISNVAAYYLMTSSTSFKNTNSADPGFGFSVRCAKQ